MGTAQHLSRLTIALLPALAFATLPAQARLPVEAIQAQTEIPEDLLLDVGIQVFDPGLPEDDEHALEDEGVFPGLRKSEARYIPFLLKNTLESTGHWGAVRIHPGNGRTTEVMVIGTIVHSNGRSLILDVRVEDASGRKWSDRRYEERVEALAYADDPLEVRDPFQSLYNELANDMLEERESLKPKKLRELRQISMLRFAADLFPSTFADYLKVSGRGRYRINRLPAADDPMLQRIAMIREREEMLVDTINEYYANFQPRMAEPYDDWRKYSFEEQIALEQIRRQARAQKIFGGLLVVAGILAGGNSPSSRTARQAAVLGGAIAVKSGMDKSKEAKIHEEAMKELAASFDSEITPLVVEVEGRTLRLEGSAETQYAEWRRLLREIFAAEASLPVDLNTPVEQDTSQPTVN